MYKIFQVSCNINKSEICQLKFSKFNKNKKKKIRECKRVNDKGHEKEENTSSSKNRP